MPLPGFWRFSCHLPIFNHFTHFLYVTGALQAASLLVKLRVGGFAYILSLCRPFKHKKILPVPLPPQPSLVYTGKSNGGSSSHCWHPWLCILAWGWDCSLAPRVSLLIFIYYMWMWDNTFHHFCQLPTPHCVSAGVCDSASLTRLDECGFFNSLVVWLPYSSIFRQSWVLFVLRYGCNSLYVCMRRQSLSAYASILARSPLPLKNLSRAGVNSSVVSKAMYISNEEINTVVS